MNARAMLTFSFCPSTSNDAKKVSIDLMPIERTLNTPPTLAGGEFNVRCEP